MLHSYTAPYNGVVTQPATQGGKAKVTFNSSGAFHRYEMVYTFTPPQLSGKIHANIFQHEKPLLTYVTIFIRLTRARSALSFTAVDAAHLPKEAIRIPRLPV